MGAGTCLKPSLRGNACECLLLCQAGKDLLRGNWQIKEMCNPSPATQCVIHFAHTPCVDALWIITQDHVVSVTCGEEFLHSELPHFHFSEALPGQG